MGLIVCPKEGNVLYFYNVSIEPNTLALSCTLLHYFSFGTQFSQLSLNYFSHICEIHDQFAQNWLLACFTEGKNNFLIKWSLSESTWQWIQTKTLTDNVQVTFLTAVTKEVVAIGYTNGETDYRNLYFR